MTKGRIVPISDTTPVDNPLQDRLKELLETHRSGTVQLQQLSSQIQQLRDSLIALEGRIAEVQDMLKA